MKAFSVKANSSQGLGRLGVVNTARGNVQTPCLFPVINFIGGTTTNCGGLWKYTRNLIFKAHLPVMSQILHFLDYHLSAQGLERWRQKTFHEWFPQFTQPLFLDSGGFQLLNNQQLDLSRYALRATPKGVLDLQLDFGADMIATLDYPLPPNLRKQEANERSSLSIENAITTLRLLQREVDDRTLVFVPIHGRTPEEIEAYIRKYITRFKRSRLERQYDGFAVGSLVPLRKQPTLVITILLKVKEVLKSMGLDGLPLHVFGVSSDLIPFLVYLGFDTFDSSTYIQNTKKLRYADPKTWANHRVTQLNEIKCQCSACQQLDLKEMRDVLMSDISFRKINGRFKSEYYALVALHNLNLHLAELDLSVQAMRNGTLEEHLIEFAHGRRNVNSVLDCLAARMPTLKAKLGQTVHLVKPPKTMKQQNVSLKYTPKDFEIPKTYRVPREAQVLFLFPCTKEKPYSASQTFKHISHGISVGLNGLSKKIHFVVVSGLYGPVPLKYDNLPQIRNYDFLLSFLNQQAIADAGKRLADYLAEYGHRFKYIVALAVSKPYRQAIQYGIRNAENVHLFPAGDKTGRIGQSVLFKHGLEECVAFLNEVTQKNGLGK